MSIEILQPNILMVEGTEEEFFFGALIGKLGLQKIQVMGIAGKTNFRPRLKAFTSSPGFSQVTSIGIVRDANSDPKAAFQSIHDALQNADLPVPEHPLVSVGPNPRIVVMILPEVNTPGMLEDLCLKAVIPDPAMICVDQYFQCLQQQNLSLPRNTSKAKIQAFLASRLEAGKRLGEAAQAGYWPWNDKAFDQVKNFLQQIVS